MSFGCHGNWEKKGPRACSEQCSVICEKPFSEQKTALVSLVRCSELESFSSPAEGKLILLIVKYNVSSQFKGRKIIEFFFCQDGKSGCGLIQMSMHNGHVICVCVANAPKQSACVLTCRQIIGDYFKSKIEF